MRYLLAAILMAVSVYLADGQTTNDVPPVRVEHHEWPAPHGQIHYRDEYYRGSQHILRVARFQNETTKTWEVWRFYYVDGKVAVIEDDKGSDKPVTVSLIKDDVTYDAFTRQPDGSVTPLSSEELAKVKAREKEFLGD